MTTLFFLCAFVVGAFCYSQDVLSGHSQILVVTSNDWTAKQGSLQLYERLSDHSTWAAIGAPMRVALGRRGLAWGVGLSPAVDESRPCKKEGDGKSPAGIFSLGNAFGFASSAEMGHLKVDYFPLNQYIEAVDDSSSRYYNCVIDNREVASDWQSSEKMSDEPLYALGMVVNHNFPMPRPGKGSAIFLHIWRGENSGTAGCTAMSLENLKAVISWLDRSKNPVLVQLPIQEYQALQREWNLPER